MRARLRASVTAALLCLGAANQSLAQENAGRFIVGFETRSEVSAIESSDARLAGMLVGGIIGGVTGGAVTAGCLWLHGMGAPAALPYCVIPAIAGVAFGAWVGGRLAGKLEGV